MVTVINGKFLDLEKQREVIAGLEQMHVLVHFDPHVEGVDVPVMLRDRPTVTLKLSNHFRKLLHVTSERITAELTFGDVSYTCAIPYPAIWGVTHEDGRLVCWPLTMPREVAQMLELSDQVKRATSLESADQEPSEKKSRARAPSKKVPENVRLDRRPRKSEEVTPEPEAESTESPVVELTTPHLTEAAPLPDAGEEVAAEAQDAPKAQKKNAAKPKLVLVKK